ncbi:MAG TPA: cell division protein FtsA [Nevskiaceae bacterium]
MSTRPRTEYFVGIDIGTAKVAALIGEAQQEGTVRVLGLGQKPCAGGLKRGVVVNVEATVEAIRAAVEAAELMANCHVRSAHVSITGSHIRSRDSLGVLPIRRGEVSRNDVLDVIDVAQTVAIPADREILHVLEQEFVVDGQGGIHEPAGIRAVRLEAKVHIVTGALSPAQDLRRCVERCGLVAEKLVLAPLASAEAVLQRDERELGVCVVDIGAGTSDIAVYHDGAVRHTAVLPIGGDQVTNDIAVAFRTPTHHAEVLKKEHGCTRCDASDAAVDDLDLPGGSDTARRTVSRQMLAEVMRPRLVEMLRYVREELYRADAYRLVAGGVVLTGGVARTRGLVELAEEVFELPVRVGTSLRVDGPEGMKDDPSLATGEGLLLFALEQQPQEGGRRVGGASGGVQRWMGRTRQWIAGHL